MPGTASARPCRARLALVAAGVLAGTLPAPHVLTAAGQPAPARAERPDLQQRNRLLARARQLQQQGKLPEAIAAAQAVLAIERRLFGDVHGDVAESLEWLAQMYQQREDLAAARAARQEVLAVRTRLHGAKDWRVTDARLALAHAERLAALTAEQRRRLREVEQVDQRVEDLGGARRFGEAIPLARQAAATRRELLGEVSEPHAASLVNLGWLYREAGEYAPAGQAYRRALAVRKELLGEDHPHYANTLNNIGWLHVYQQEYDRAEQVFRQAAEIYRKAGSETSAGHLISLENLAQLYSRLADTQEQREDFAAARRARSEGLAVTTRLYGARDWRATDARLALDDVALLEKLDGPQRRQLHEADTLLEEAGRLDGQGKAREALGLAQKALRIRQAVYGPRHRRCGDALTWVGLLCQSLRDYARAEPLLRQALDLRKEVLGEDHPDYAISLNNLAALYGETGEYARAVPLGRKVVEIRAKVLGERHPEYATSLNNLGWLYQTLGRYAEAEPLHRRALEIRKQMLGEKDPAYATSLNNLALVYWSMGEHARAEPLYRQALEIRRQVLGEQHPTYATSLNNLALLYAGRGDYTRAERLYRQALAIRKQVLGERHPDYALSLNNLAALYREMGDYARAKPLYQKALATRRQVLGENHPDFAMSLANLAELYAALGDYARAEPLYQQALAIRKQVLGKNHPEYAQGLNNLGLLYKQMGDHGRAEPLLRRALEIKRQALGERHPEYASGLNNLAWLYWSVGEYARAEPLYRQALEVRKQALGERHPDYATSLNNLALLYQDTGEYARAERLYRRALEIKKHALGENHADYALGLNNLAWLYYRLGDYAKAEPLYRQALSTRGQALGEQHPLYADSVHCLALLHWSEAVGLGLLHPQAFPLHNLAVRCGAATDLQQARRLLRRALEISRANLELAAAAQSQRQQLAMLGELRFRLDAYLSLAVQTGEAPVDQYREVLAWKGAVGRRQRFGRLARRQPELARDFAELDRVSSHLAALALAAPDPGRLQDRRKQIQQLTLEKERLEAALARHSASFRQEQELGELGPAQLQAVLPADAALIDFLTYSHGSPSPGKKGGWKVERRLTAFVVRRDTIVRLDLGGVVPVEAALERWRQALQRRFMTEGDARLGAEVRRLLWRPLEPHLRGARLVLVSPDGALARVPLGALPGGRKDSYLLEEVALATVPIPQLLPQLLAQHPGSGKAEPSLLLVGDVRYDGAAAGGEAAAESRAAPRGGALVRWPALEGTRAEVAAIKDSFQRRFRKGVVTDLREEEATEAQVRKEAPAHRYLHLATHGFFAPPQLRSALAEASRGGGPGAGNLFEQQGVAGFHPGLLSGVVLAGANQPAGADGDDGILTALEVEALDLGGVELATLSACETGLGEEAGGEGLLGLQRAFQLAGARSVVASLWQVDDKATRELMVRFYENLWKRKLPRLEALRQAQLWMLKEGAGRGMVDVRVPKERLPVEDGRLAPYYWAAFSLSGDWR
jgi:CHAT domain-containing protein/Tfp pilus assembly protein PilF